MNYNTDLKMFDFHKWSISGQMTVISNFAQSKKSHKRGISRLILKIYMI